ncbi:Dabb family protein [Pseudomonas sp. BN417]|uniref:Dabb family protein n=1 Tax=Pseudomonas sp. BN417 TaxID=2567890 RepID=UPI002458C395|nr:Dabb family protein [Pseudomonas sp. BN417]MDH4554106.1 Dabb family protein [Pseudomonas sp. BN417]
MWHETAQLYLDPDAGPGEVADELQRRAQGLAGLKYFSLGRNLEGSWGAGDFTLDLCFASNAFQASTATSLAQLPGVSRVDRVAYERLGGGQRAVGLQGGIWRTLLLRVRPHRDPGHVAALERDLLRMPAYMSGIRNWQLSRVCSNSGWTHVWQQEFARVDDLQGEYLIHPFHWGWVDRWFDPEFPEWTVEAIAHAFCPLATSILTHPLSLLPSENEEFP